MPQREECLSNLQYITLMGCYVAIKNVKKWVTVSKCYKQKMKSTVIWLWLQQFKKKCPFVLEGCRGSLRNENSLMEEENN